MLAATLVETPDGDWWKKVFTDAEGEALTETFEKIVDEFAEKFMPHVEPIDVVVLVGQDEFFTLLHTIAEASRAGFDLTTIGIAFAQSYFDEDAIPLSQEGSEDAGMFYSPYDQDEEDDDE